MNALFAKPLDEIRGEDLQSLIDNEVPESDRLEYKREVPAKSGTNPRPGAIGDYAKRAVCESVVSFGNAVGGVYLLGIDEKAADSGPPVAAKLVGIPHYQQIIERLKNILHASIEPQLNIEIAGIPLRDKEEVGVVVVRVASSVRRPHAYRSKSSLSFTVRRGDRTRKMNVPEVHDMVIRTAEWQERLEKRLAHRSTLFQKQFSRVCYPRDAYGIRLTAMPISNDVQLPLPFVNEHSLVQHYEKPAVRVTFRDSDNREHLMRNVGHTYNMNWIGRHALWHPILRGAQMECADRGSAAESRTRPPSTGRYAYQEFHQDGLVEMGFISATQLADTPIDEQYGWGLRFYDNVPISMLAEITEWTRALRHQGGVPNAEYIVDVEFCIEGNVDGDGSSKTHVSACDGRPDWAWLPRCPDGREIHTLGQYPLNDYERTEDLLADFDRDLWNWRRIDIAKSSRDYTVTL